MIDVAIFDIEKIKKYIKKKPKLYDFLLNLIKLKTFLLTKEAWGFWSGYVFFPIRGFINVHGFSFMRRPYDKIELVKDRHKGERCFIVSTGPSLTLDDINLIQNEKTISMNTIYRLYPNTKWRPTYYTLGDIWFADRLVKENEFDFDDFATDYCFFSRQSRKLIGDAPKNIFLNVCWLDHIINFGSEKFKYNPNLLFGMYDFYSSTHGGILLAMYMGFKEIYLIGVDNGYAGRQHFDDNGDSEEYLDKLVKTDEKIRIARNRAYVELDMIAKKKGINIFNCTRGGLLEVFPRKELDEVVGDGGVSQA